MLDYAALAAIIKQITNKDVLVIGDLMLDVYLYGEAERLSPEAPVPVLLVEQEEDRLGGAANVANNIRALGGNPILMGVIGQDLAAERFLSKLQQHNIATDYLIQAPAHTTATKTRVIARGQQVVRIDRERPQPLAANFAMQLENNMATLTSKCDAVIFSDYGKGLFTPTLLERLIAKLPPHLYTSVDPFPDHLPFYDGIRSTTPNRLETLRALRIETWQKFDHQALAQKLIEQTAFQEVFITLGAEGIIWCNATKQTGHHPTRAKQVYDVSGAGDTVIAAMTLARSQGIDIDAAVQFANIAAGLVVAKPGTATVSPGEILASVA